jgi:acyl-coenzyme A thioesterase PaaI-like protein
MIRETISTRAAPSAVRLVRDQVRQALQILTTGEHSLSREISEAALGPATPSFIARSPVVGSVNALSVPLTMRVIQNGPEVIAEGRVTFTDPYEGPPGCVHGGFIACVFDEILGVAQSTSGNPGMTANLAIDYRSPTPLGKPLVFRGWCERIDGRKIFTRGTLHHGDTLCAEATGLFLSMRPEMFERLLAMRDTNNA